MLAAAGLIILCILQKMNLCPIITMRVFATVDGAKELGYIWN